MKAYIIQPPYSRDVSQSDEFFDYKINLLDSINDADIIVLPEYSDVPCATADLEQTLYYHKKYINTLLEKCKNAAMRCKAAVFVNALCKVETGYRNTTYVFDKNGDIVGKYFKKHLPPLELETLALDSDYTFEFSEPYVLELDGLRYGFLTCYDFYFYEAFANMARQNVDIVIGCSLQRSDSHDAIEIMCRNLAYNTNAHVIRSSVSFDENSEICGASMIVSPTGKVLANMKGKFGIGCAEFDPADKYYKPAGYGNPDAAHYQYIEYGRKPWQYRPGGSAIIPGDDRLPYPRLCAHRGFSTIAPENSMPAFGAAVAMGAQEIEFDLWTTKDNKWVSIHDYSLDRVSDGTGAVWEYTLDELKKFDFGCKFSDKFKGLKILTLEDILKKLSCHVIMNIHIKTREEGGGDPNDIYDDNTIKELINLVRKYDCQNHVYFMTVSENLHRKLAEFAPEICRCMGENFDKNSTIVDRAIRTGCKKVQLFKPHFDQAMIDKAHEHGIICNVFWSDDPAEAKHFLDMGIDTILTNDYNTVKTGLDM